MGLDFFKLIFGNCFLDESKIVAKFKLTVKISILESRLIHRLLLLLPGATRAARLSSTDELASPFI